MASTDQTSPFDPDNPVEIEPVSFSEIALERGEDDLISRALRSVLDAVCPVNMRRAEVNGPRPGRPSRYTVEMHQTLCRLSALGASPQTTAEAAGISVSTLQRWFQQYPALKADMDRTAKLSEVGLIMIVRQLAEGDGPTALAAAKFMLERRFGWTPEAKLSVDVTKTPEEIAATIATEMYGITQDDNGNPDAPKSSSFPAFPV